MEVMSITIVVYLLAKQLNIGLFKDHLELIGDKKDMSTYNMETIVVLHQVHIQSFDNHYY
mgnify:CR=1 FL=1